MSYAYIKVEPMTENIVIDFFIDLRDSSGAFVDGVQFLLICLGHINNLLYSMQFINLISNKNESWINWNVLEYFAYLAKRWLYHYQGAICCLTTLLPVKQLVLHTFLYKKSQIFHLKIKGFFWTSLLTDISKNQ